MPAAVSPFTSAGASGDVTCSPEGGVPTAFATFFTTPALTSACVNSYVAKQFVDSPGANSLASHSISDSVPVPEKVPSFTATFVSVTLPELVTTNRYVTFSPAFHGAPSSCAAVFTRPMPAAVSPFTSASSVASTCTPSGDVPTAFAAFNTLPVSISACVNVYSAEHLASAPTASSATSHVITGVVPLPENETSSTATLVSG